MPVSKTLGKADILLLSSVCVRAQGSKCVYNCVFQMNAAQNELY